MGASSLAIGSHLTPVCPPPHRALLALLDLRVLLDNVVWSACPVREEKEASPVFLAPL